LGELEDERQHKEKLTKDCTTKEESWKQKGEALQREMVEKGKGWQERKNTFKDEMVGVYGLGFDGANV